MEWSKSIFLFLGCLFLFPTSGQSVDVCDGPFSKFLSCMSKDAEARIDNYNKEITPSALSRVQQCFSQSGCPPPDFSQAQVGFFVQEPWTSRVNAFLNLLENMDPKVQHCMTDYFKDKLSAKINECLRKHGPPDVKNFQMPPIPGGYNIDMPKMKTVLLDRMMVQYQLSQCNTGNEQNIIGCVKVARGEVDDGGMCRTRENCVHDTIKDNMCHDRFDKVHQTACQCFNNEQGRKDLQKEVKNTILSGALEKKFKECHQENGVPYPQDKVNAAKKAARDGFMDFLQNQGHVPPGVEGAMRVGKQVFTEMSEQWKGAFCSDCTAAPPPLPQQLPPRNNPNMDALRLSAADNQPQLAPSPLANPNQPMPPFPQPAPQTFPQPAPQSQAVFPQAAPAASFNSASGGRFVVPPPLPPQAPQSQFGNTNQQFGGANQQVPQANPVAQSSSVQQQQFQQQNQQLSFEDFKQQLSDTFGANG